MVRRPSMGEGGMTMTDQHPSPRRPHPVRWARLVLTVLAVVLPAAAFGVGTASTDATLGPHLARYEVTLDGEVTVDLGPLGTLVLDSPAPLDLGVRADVEEIPRELTALDESSTLEALGADLQRYVQFFAAPRATVDTVVRGLALDALRRTVAAAVVLVATAWLLARLLGPARRAELGGRLAAVRGPVAAGSVVVLLTALTLTASAQRTGPDAAAPASPVFDGTPLQGARITGRLAGLIDTYGGQAVQAYRANEAFYDAAAASVDQAWSDRARLDAELAARAQRSTITVPSPEDGPTDGASTDSGPGQGAATRSTPSAATATGTTPTTPTSPTAGVSEAAAEDADSSPAVVALLVSDLHCNVGMARVVARVATLAHVDLVLNAGDSTVDGTAVEQYCVESFAAAVPDGVPYVVADGNHDSTQTQVQERGAGAVVLDGSVVDVAGLRILGDSDPNETRVGSGTRPVGEESATETGARLADAACADGHVDLLLVHTPVVGDEALGRGCVRAQVSGHMHTRIGPLVVGRGVRYVSSSSAGATLGMPTVGPLQGTAELTVLRFDPDSGAVLDHRLVRVLRDGGAQVGPALRWPTVALVQARPGDPV